MFRMHSVQQPIIKDLVLVGGGHSHAIVLRMFGMNPLPGVRITLITDVVHTPYSGMLPGHIAGFYNFDQSHIDLRPLANFAGAQLYHDRAIALDLNHNRVICADRPPVAFDVLSIDIGSTPATISVPGAADYAIPAKPVPQLLDRWNHIVEQVARSPKKHRSLATVGGGTGGVELTLSMQARLNRILASQHQHHIDYHLFHRSDGILSGKSSYARRQLEALMRDRGIHLHLGENVSKIELKAFPQTQALAYPDSVVMLQCESGLSMECDRVFWVTQASAPHWLRESGLSTDSAGFIQVNEYLQSVSHSNLFAAGDIATMIKSPRPKAGVFAVRQGKPLFKNLRRTLLNLPLKPYHPQQEFLTLIGTGTGNAIASRGVLGLGPFRLLWNWKDRIDRQFMQQFSDLPEMKQKSEDRVPENAIAPLSTSDKTPVMRCAGCGSKVGSTILERVLTRLKSEALQESERDDIIIGLNAPDDCAVVQVPEGQLMVHTIDHFPSLINDPFIFGQIAANHCLSDIFAMGAKPQSALAIATLPYAAETILEETLYQLLAGATKVLQYSNTSLVGGHTTEGSELSFGLSCNGLVDPDKLLRKGGMKPGDVLIITKALGTGTLFAADRQRKAKGRWIEGAIASMLLSNQAAAECVLQYHARACTDITGFGLLGHLMETIRASGVAVELHLEALPVLPGARKSLQQGILSTLHPENFRASDRIHNLSDGEHHPNFLLLFDPQTAGGLLAAIPAEKAEDCLRSLQGMGYTDSRTIGRVTAAVEGVLPIQLIV